MSEVPAIEFDSLGALMPMHLLLDRDGNIRSCGPTLRKLIGRARHVQAVFELRRCSPGARLMDSLIAAANSGERVFLALRGSTLPALRGEGVAIQNGDILINFGFGIGAIEAISTHNLTDADFAANELAIEIMYLHKASQAIRGELARHSLRLEEAWQVAEMQSFTDPLTKLLNRRGFDMAFRAALEARSRADPQRQEFALLQIDLDWFKEVNDRFGHAAGDAVLQGVAAALKQELRDEDSVARVGGDEFLILLPGAMCRGIVEQVGDRIIRAIQQPIRFEQHLCRISASIGGALSVGYDLIDPAEMLLHTDQALYSAKKAGRGRVWLSRPQADRPRPQDDRPVSSQPSGPVHPAKPAKRNGRDRPV